MNVNQYATVNLEIVNEARKHQLLIAMGTPWEEAEQVVDGFKATLLEMKRLSQKPPEPEATQPVDQPAPESE